MKKKLILVYPNIPSVLLSILHNKEFTISEPPKDVFSDSDGNSDVSSNDEKKSTSKGPNFLESTNP